MTSCHMAQDDLGLDLAGRSLTAAPPDPWMLPSHHHHLCQNENGINCKSACNSAGLKEAGQMTSSFQTP